MYALVNFITEWPRSVRQCRHLSRRSSPPLGPPRDPPSLGGAGPFLPWWQYSEATRQVSPIPGISTPGQQSNPDRLNTIHMHHRTIFDGDMSEGYNGLSGDYDVDFDFVRRFP